ncbi:MAG: cob(I)yrinic acid a,c-diamide adenosyltransferase [Deltaproteobacteria bacterium]|nr:cob(I)yrinic acid a,c-diamide adenosyltransferase [Deltaproteobacteria bacterium]
MSKESHTKGLILVFTGDGKGKTTAALGMALRAAGQQLRVLILQFMKGKGKTGEIQALAGNHLSITIRQCGRGVFFKTSPCDAADISMAQEGLETFRRAMESKDYDLIVLDEINVAVHFGLLSIDEVIRAIREKPPELHLVLTGRNAHDAVLDIADLVTEMREVKHPYRQGVEAQKGIEY